MTRTRIRAARIVAVLADALQLFLFPLFGEGFLSPLDDAVDVAVGGILIWLVGFHWAFLPGFAAELAPGVDLAPTWTAAVLIATGAGGGRRWVRWVIVALVIGLAVGVVIWRANR